MSKTYGAKYLITIFRWQSDPISPTTCVECLFLHHRAPPDLLLHLQFMINGPNSATGAGSLIIILEREVDYLVEVSPMLYLSRSFPSRLLSMLIFTLLTGSRQDPAREHQSHVGQARRGGRLHGIRDGEWLLLSLSRAIETGEWL
jgi:hypothetical protein